MKLPKKNHNYTLVKTGDGTLTLYSPDYDEHMHTLSGAYEEALLKHVYPSGILEVRLKQIHVLDVGFGLGYNILALISECAKKNYDGSIKIVSFEKERNRFLQALNRISFNDERDETYSLIKKAYVHGMAHKKNVYITVIFGDARKAVRDISTPLFDAVFFDPFSPSKNPELWTVDFFKEIYRLIKNTGVLTTYSSALQIRKALIDAGFVIGRGPSVGGKREGTLASKTTCIKPFDADELLALRSNSLAVPYRDCRLSDSPTAILKRRREEIKYAAKK
jgi:chorismate dehydratase